LNDIIEHGSQAFSQYVINMTDVFEKREAVTLVTSQFLSFRDFSEKMNMMVNALFHVMKYNSIDDLIINVNKTMKTVFSADTIHLWMQDSVKPSTNTLGHRHILHLQPVQKAY